MESHAKALGATAFGNSKAKGKRYYVIYNNKIINFGSDIGSTYIDHHDQKKRRAWQARHSKIKKKQGKYVYKLPSSPAYWSWHLLW